MHPSDPSNAWLYAAELTAYLVELSRWDWGVESVRRAEAARSLADLVYVGADRDVLVPLLEELTAALPNWDGPEAWLANIGAPDFHAEMRLRASTAFARLRYLVYEDIPPRAA